MRGDPRLLRRLIRNLLDNASRHGKPPVEIEVMLEGDTITLIISDHGEGIPKSEWQNVFKPFYRLSKSQNKTGSGLGLALVAQIAKRHGGTAAIVQKQDTQSSIRVTLPSI